MKRILIIGNPGAGKSTLAVELGPLLRLPVIHLDKYFWNPGWVMTPRDIWRSKVSQLVTGDQWIIDGNYDSSIDLRFPRADTIIFLDFPTRVCLMRVIIRVLKNYRVSRPDMADGCPDKFDFVFLKYVLRFRKKIRPVMLDAIDRLFPGSNVIFLKNPKEIRSFLDRTSTQPEQ